MAELLQRDAANPLLRPADCPPSRPQMQVTCLLNPGAFEHDGRVGLLVRVAERPHPERGWVSATILDPEAEGGVRVIRVRADDPDLQGDDPRLFHYRGVTYLTTLSHLRLAWSDDGERFAIDTQPTLVGEGDHEAFGIEDCRVACIGGVYHLTYTAVSRFGVAVGLRTTRDWRRFESHGIIFPPHNKDCALIPERVGGGYWALHRPSVPDFGGHNIWLAASPDLRHFGAQRCLATPRPGLWDAQRVGAGAAPIATDAGWLVLYHGADAQSRYALGVMLLDRDDPRTVVARGTRPVMEPTAPYERSGFFNNVVFTNGHVIDGDALTIYYGAGDEVIGAATGSIAALVDAAQR